MGKSKKNDQNQSLITPPNTIDDTLQVKSSFLPSLFHVFLATNQTNIMLNFLQLFDQTAYPTDEKVNWNNVLQISDHISKQATIGV